MTSGPPPNVFEPPRRRGLWLHGGLALALGGGSAASMFFALAQSVGGVFVGLLLLSLALFAPLPLVLYRAYALLNASYSLTRDGLRLRWGLRAEDLPLTEIEWVRPASDLAMHLPLPIPPWPGALLGVLNVDGLGPVEFIASDARRLLLVATPRRVYAISPADPSAFMRAFQRAFEMGSLEPLSTYSARPAAYLSRVWTDRLARALLLAALVFSTALFIAVSLAASARNSVSLGFTPDGLPVSPGPGASLLLLPVLSVFLFMADLVAGLYFYRRPEHKPVSYLIWIAGAVTPILFSIALFFIL